MLEHAGYRVVRTAGAGETLHTAAATQPDVIMITVGSPDGDGVALCERLRHDPAIAAGTPVVLIGAAPLARAVRLAGLAVGAWDVLALPMDAGELLAKLHSYVQVKREGAAARAAGLVDESTGLYDARGMERRVQELWADAARRRFALACVVFAADPAPGVDAASAAAASVAHHVGKALRAHGRLSDVIGRWEAGEFAVIAPGTDAAGAATLAHRLMRLIEHEPLPSGVPLPAFILRAGYEALEDASASTLDPPDLLARAHAAVQTARREAPSQPPVRRYRQEASPQAS